MSNIFDSSRKPKPEAGFNSAKTIVPGPVFKETTRSPSGAMAPVPRAVMTEPSAAEEFRILRAKIRALDQERPMRCYGVTSSSAGEGKSTICLGLAAAFAQEPGRRILLIDADLRKPSLEQYLGLPPSAGLSEWLEGNSSEIMLRRVEPYGFDLLSAGLTFSHCRPELLGSKRMERLLEAARDAFDAVVLDFPPLVPVADSVIVQDLLDGFLFVVRARYSPREAILRALSHLKKDRVRGVVFNAHKEVIPGYRTYGYRYGQSQ